LFSFKLLFGTFWVALISFSLLPSVELSFSVGVSSARSVNGIPPLKLLLWTLVCSGFTFWASMKKLQASQQNWIKYSLSSDIPHHSNAVSIITQSLLDIFQSQLSLTLFEVHLNVSHMLLILGCQPHSPCSQWNRSHVRHQNVVEILPSTLRRSWSRISKINTQKPELWKCVCWSSLLTVGALYRTLRLV